MTPLQAHTSFKAPSRLRDVVAKPQSPVFYYDCRMVTTNHSKAHCDEGRVKGYGRLAMTQRLCLMVPHLVLLWLRVNAQTSAETVFLSKRQLNTSGSTSIGHCLTGTTSTAFVAHPSWSFDEPHQSDRISPKLPLQDLLRQWSFLVLIIVTPSSQVYQQTRSLGYSELWTTRHARSRYTSPQRISLVTCEIPLPEQDRDSDSDRHTSKVTWYHTIYL